MPPPRDGMSRIWGSVLGDRMWLWLRGEKLPRTQTCSNNLKTWLIDHGASLYFHYDWEAADAKVASPFAFVRDHVLLPWADDLESASSVAHQKITDAELTRIANLVPAAWLTFHNDVPAEIWQERYVRFLTRRLENSVVFEQDVRRARASSV